MESLTAGRENSSNFNIYAYSGSSRIQLDTLITI